MKVRHKLLGVLLSVCLMVSAVQGNVLAASGSVSLSNASGKVGSTVTVTGTVKCSGGAIGSASVTLSYDPSALQYVSGSSGTNGGSGSVRYAGVGDGSATSLSFSMKFKILKEGSYKISGSADAYNFDEEQLSMSVGSSTVKGTVDTSDSSDNNNSGTGNQNNTAGNGTAGTQEEQKDTSSKLSSLKVYPGTLSPSFSANTRNYQVTVPEGTTEVTISATAKSAKAKVNVSGGKNLQPGENSARVTVTAEDGSTTTYSITILCGEVQEEPKEVIQILDQEYQIVEVIDAAQIPAGFVLDKATYHEKEYAAVSHQKGNMKLLYLQNTAGENAFFIYEEEQQTFYPFLMIQISELRYIIPLPAAYAAQQLEGMELTSLTLQEKVFDAWREDPSGEYYILYAMSDEGMEGFYRYDAVDATYQRYSMEKEEVVEEEPEVIESDSLEQTMLYILLGVGILILILLILVIVLAVKLRKKKVESSQENVEKVDNSEKKVYDDYEFLDLDD